jgi:hypothetical protein
MDFIAYVTTSTCHAREASLILNVLALHADRQGSHSITRHQAPFLTNCNLNNSVTTYFWTTVLEQLDVSSWILQIIPSLAQCMVPNASKLTFTFLWDHLPEDGAALSFRNVGYDLTNYVASQPRSHCFFFTDNVQNILINSYNYHSFLVTECVNHSLPISGKVEPNTVDINILMRYCILTGSELFNDKYQTL